MEILNSAITSRLPPSTLQPDNNNNSSKKKKSAKSKDVALRFEVELDLTSNNCTYVSFADLVRRENAKKKKERRDRQAAGGLKDPMDPFGEDDDDEVARIAARYEQKYGRGTTYEDLVDKGEGYDENDSFIDNAEAYDEIIPPNLTTELGGFYVNTGELKFKAVEDEQEEAANGGKGTNEVEDEFEKASLLQKLKRKRNRIEDDSNSGEPIKPPGRKPKAPKEKKEKVPKQNPTPHDLSLYDGTKQAAASKAAASAHATTIIRSSPVHPAVDPTTTPSAQPIPVKKYKRQSSSAIATTEQSMLEQMVAPLPAKQRKLTSKDTPATVTSTLYGTKGPSDAMTTATNAASLAHSLISNTIQQMINENLVSNSAAAAVVSNGLSASAIGTNPSLILLKQNLLNAKVPYEIINSVPISKPMVNPDGMLASYEWNRYLVDVFKKTTSAPTKSRNKVFDYLAGYIGVPREALLIYSAKIANEPLESVQSVRKYTKSSSTSGASTPSPAPSPKPSSSIMGAPSGYGSSGGGAQSLVMPKKNSSGAGGGSSGGAINLSTNQSSSYGEGLAGKLMAPVETTGGGTGSGRKSGQSDRKIKIEAINPSPLNINPNHPNFAMLQSLASLASSTSPHNTMSTGRISHHGGGQLPPTSLMGPNNNSNRSATPPTSVLSRGGSSASTTIPTSTTMAGNPNSLLLSSSSATAAAGSPNSSSTSGQQSGLHVSPRRNEQLFASLFSSLPNLFSNTELINRFLQDNPTRFKR